MISLTTSAKSFSPSSPIGVKVPSRSGKMMKARGLGLKWRFRRFPPFVLRPGFDIFVDSGKAYFPAPSVETFSNSFFSLSGIPRMPSSPPPSCHELARVARRRRIAIHSSSTIPIPPFLPSVPTVPLLLLPTSTTTAHFPPFFCYTCSGKKGGELTLSRV